MAFDQLSRATRKKLDLEALIRRAIQVLPVTRANMMPKEEKTIASLQTMRTTLSMTASACCPYCGKGSDCDCAPLWQ